MVEIGRKQPVRDEYRPITDTLLMATLRKVGSVPSEPDITENLKVNVLSAPIQSADDSRSCQVCIC